MSIAVRSEPPALARASLLLLVVAVSVAAVVPLATARAVGGTVDHLLVSEVVTGGASASDELIELYNPTLTPLPLEGLELVYVSATGATISRRAAWAAGAPAVPAGGHVLVANESGTYASIADAVYATGMAAAGGSVAIRIQGASTAIDAVGWGTAASTWREGMNAPAPAAGSSIERLPGGWLGSTQDTDDNASDMVERPVPDPQNLGSAPTPDPGEPQPTPTSVATPSPTVTPSSSVGPTATPASTVTPTATATPGPGPVSVAAARAALDGAVVTIEATALTASDFHDGGGYLADPTAGIAVLLDDGSFTRGGLLRVTGTIDDRFSQRTIRSTAADVVDLGPGTDPVPGAVATGAISEAQEGTLVRVSGEITGSGTALTTGTAFDVDDGSGSLRIIVPVASAIDLSGWTAGATLDLVGVVGQRDSTGSGTEGYRVMPRYPGDVLGLRPPQSASPAPSDTVDPTPSPTASGEPVATISIADARAAAKNSRVRVRGVVTLATGMIDQETAAIQDASAAILLRLGDEAGELVLGQLVELEGMRSTKSGMETLRVTHPPSQLGTGPEPAPRAVRTGDAGEAHEALLVLARGALVTSARRASSGSVSFEIDDGSGPLRVSLDASMAADDEPLAAGTWVEVTGILGQETTGAQPQRGYRIWPRTIADIRVLAEAAGQTDGETTEDDDESSDGGAAVGGLDRVGGADAAGLRIGATLVAGPWPELEIGGLLWDGSRVAAIDEASSDLVSALVGTGSVPVSVELGGLTTVGTEPVSGASVLSLPREPGFVSRSNQPATPPRSQLPPEGAEPAWVSLVGRLGPGGTELVVNGSAVPLEMHCDGRGGRRGGEVSVTGIATAGPWRLVVPCGGIVAAPLVARAAPVTRSDGATHAVSASAAGRPAALDPRRLMAAGLLALAAVMLVLAVIGRRALLPPVEAPPGDERASDIDDGVASADGDEAVLLPRLTLVRIPNERGP